MERDALQDLQECLSSPDRKPLVVRGARQVGKTWLVREFARRSGRRLLELNFERKPRDASLFTDPDPAVTVRRVEARFNQKIEPGSVLLFLDEIQAAPEAFAKLWWFAEDMPELPVITAGSHLDFLLAGHSFSMPVGRIRYLHLDNMSFDEFLAGTGDGGLREFLAGFSWDEDLPEALHERLLSRYREYLFVGGMPEAVAAWVRDRSPVECAEVHHRLLATFRDDFHKYRERVPAERLVRVLDAVPRLLGRKFVFSQVSEEERSAPVKQALDLLCKARVTTRVEASHCTGVPLAAEVRERVFKFIFLDVGLVSASLGLSLEGVQDLGRVALVNRGALLEQAIGQALRGSLPRFMEPRLHYWTRERKGGAAEIDYVVQSGANVVPVEVKAGKTGTLKSLHVFMAARNLPAAVRFHADRPSIVSVEVRTTSGAPVSYVLLSLPFYLCGQLRRLLEEMPRSPGSP